MATARVTQIASASIPQRDALRGPTLRQGAIVAVVGYLLGFGVPFAVYSILPKLFVANNPAQTSANILADPGALATAIVAMLLNFIGDILAAWGLYVILRPVNERVSMLAAWLRVVYATVGIAAAINLATAYRLVTVPDYLTAFGRDGLYAQVQFAVASFNVQFALSLAIFGVYLVALGLLMVPSGYVPKWLGAIVLIDGFGWIVTELQPYVLPRVDLGFVMVTSFGELLLLGWLIGWGTRLKERA